ncbi:MAG: hypothetical protein AAF081_17410, partial [Actinomycetota bacterium]
LVEGVVGERQAGAVALHLGVHELAVGVNNEIEDNWPVRQYHKLLEWDIVKQPWLTRTAEKMLNPVLGKSLVVQATKSPLRTEKLSEIREAANAGT